MAKTLQAQYTLYLDREAAARLERLATQTRIPKSVLFREAVDLLLTKYKVRLPASARRSKS